MFAGVPATSDIAVFNEMNKMASKLSSIAHITRKQLFYKKYSQENNAKTLPCRVGTHDFVISVWIKFWWF